MGHGLVDQWVNGFGVLGSVGFFFFFGYDRCLKEEVGMAEVARGSLKFSVGRGLWVSQV